MAETNFLRRSLRWVLVITLLAAALARISPPAAAQSVCAVASFAEEGEPARWLEDCGHVNLHGLPDQVARRALAKQATLLGLRQDELSLLTIQKSPLATHVRFTQQHRGVPVYLGQVLVQYNADGEVQLINNHTLPKLDIDVTPTITAVSAMDVALAEVPGSGQLRARSEQRLVIYGEGVAPRLAWHIVLYPQRPVGDWHVMVDARSGALLGAWDELWRKKGSAQSYAVNPVQQTGNTGLRDNDDATSAALEAARVPLVLNNLSADTNRLKGRYVDITAANVLGCNLPYVPGRADEPSRVYTYTRDDDRFEEVVAYAAIDGVQSWFQSLGFTNVNNRAIPVNVHCTDADNSYFSSSDGALYFGDGGVDDAEDPDIVIHEYGHAVQQDQVPGWGPGLVSEQRAMGEGFSDFLAGMYFISTGSQAHLERYKYCIGEWDATYCNPVTPNNAGSGCLRWINGRSEITGDDIGAYSGTPVNVHNDGRYWSAALTCIYEGLGANAAARDMAMRLVLQHHFSLTPDSSNQAFERAVDALRLADVHLFDGANQQLIIQCAQDRGLIATPQLFVPHMTAPTEDEAVDTGSAVMISWSAVGNPETTIYAIQYALCRQEPTFSDNVEGGVGGWTVSHSGGTEDWTQVTSAARSPDHSWFASGARTANEQYLVSPPIQIGSDQLLSFWHTYEMEQGFDGGVVEVSIDAGTSWTDLEPLLSLHGYDMTINGGALVGRPAFTGSSGGWVETQADLTSFGGQTIRLRFRQADDESIGSAGWWVDDIAVRNQAVWLTAGTTTAGAASFNWTAPAELGPYCLRVRGEAPGYLASSYSAVRSVIVVDPNMAPTITPIADLIVYAGVAIPVQPFTIGDAAHAPGRLFVTASSSNQALLPDVGIVLGGAETMRTVTLIPAAGRFGVATITISVSDGRSITTTSFMLTVLAQEKVYLPLVRR
jgi:Zn-dependent metalloprotease